MGNEASKFNHIFSEITASGNQLVLRGEQIGLPDTT